MESVDIDQLARDVLTRLSDYGMHDTGAGGVRQGTRRCNASGNNDLGRFARKARRLPMVSLVFVYTPLTEIRFR